jgi:hypothetical protein
MVAVTDKLAAFQRTDRQTNKSIKLLSNLGSYGSLVLILFYANFRDLLTTSRELLVKDVVIIGAWACSDLCWYKLKQLLEFLPFFAERIDFGLTINYLKDPLGCLGCLSRICGACETWAVAGHIN